MNLNPIYQAYKPGPELTLRFYYTEDVDYDCDLCNAVLPSGFYISNRSGGTEISGDPEDEQDIYDLCRFVSYKMRKDDIDKTVFVKDFQRTVKRICKHFNDDGIAAQDLEVYGDFDSNTGFFVPKRYEFTVMEPKKHFGELVDGSKSKELIFAVNKNIQLTQNAVWFDKPVLVTDSTARGKRLDDDDYIRKYKIKRGWYNLFQVFTVLPSGTMKRVAACLLHRDNNFHSVYWDDQALFITDKTNDSYWMIGSTDIDFAGKAVELSTDGSFENGVQSVFDHNFAAFLNRVPDEGNTGKKKDWKFSTWYLAKDNDDQIIGLAFDTRANKPCEGRNLNNLI